MKAKTQRAGGATGFPAEKPYRPRSMRQRLEKRFGKDEYGRVNLRVLPEYRPKRLGKRIPLRGPDVPQKHDI